jgi:uncharacterized membrane protein AbrB (regulator of aidB expression)
MQTLKSIHRVLVVVFLLAALSEFFLAGTGVFGAQDFDAHRALGNVLVVLALLIAVVGVLARRLIVPSVVLPALMVLQQLLATVGEDISAWVAAFHPLNGVVVTGLCGYMFGQWLRERQAGPREAAVQPAVALRSAPR